MRIFPFNPIMGNKNNRYNQKNNRQMKDSSVMEDRQQREDENVAVADEQNNIYCTHNEEKEGERSKEVLDTDIFNKISKEKLEFLRNLLADMEGKSQMQKPQILMAYMTRMRQQGIVFTSDEMKLISDTLSQGLSDEEKARVDKFKNTINNMNM